MNGHQTRNDKDCAEEKIILFKPHYIGVIILKPDNYLLRVSIVFYKTINSLRILIKKEQCVNVISPVIKLANKKI